MSGLPGGFPYYTIFICKFRELLVHETFFRSWRHLKIVRRQSTWLWLLLCFTFFLSCVIFDQHLKITFRESSALPLKKSTPFSFLTFALKIQKVQVTPFLPTYQHWKFFSNPPSPSPLQKGGRHYGSTSNSNKSV